MVSPKKILFGLLSLLGLSVICVAIYYNPDRAWIVVRLFTDAEYLIEFTTKYEPYTLIFLLLLQILQIIFAFIPGEPIGVAYGSIYGVYWGSLFGIIGTTLGTIVPIAISKMYGRPVVKRMIGKEKIDKYDEITESTGVKPFIVLIIIPIVPDDVISYLAGLSDIDSKKLIVWISLARSVGIVALTVFGDSLIRSDWSTITVLTIITIVISIVLIWRYDGVIGDNSES